MAKGRAAQLSLLSCNIPRVFLLLSVGNGSVVKRFGRQFAVRFGTGSGGLRTAPLEPVHNAGLAGSELVRTGSSKVVIGQARTGKYV